jgi:hypothetical protein
MARARKGFSTRILHDHLPFLFLGADEFIVLGYAAWLIGCFAVRSNGSLGDGTDSEVAS